MDKEASVDNRLEDLYFRVAALNRQHVLTSARLALTRQALALPPVEDVSLSDYKFKTSSVDLICLQDIAVDMNRNNPVAEVVLQGAEYKKFHHLLVHVALLLKVDAIRKHYDKVFRLPAFDAGKWGLVVSLANTLTPVTHSVYSLDLTVFGHKFSEVMEALFWAWEFPLHVAGEEACTVIVRYK